MSAVFDHNVLKIASHCPARWDEMTGNDRARFCQQCQKHVYNLSTMTKAEVEQLVIEKEGKFCGRMYRRKDGTVLTADCPSGIAVGWLNGFPWLVGAAAVFFLGVLVFFGRGGDVQGEMWVPDMPPPTNAPSINPSSADTPLPSQPDVD